MCDGEFKVMDEVQCDRLTMYHEGSLGNMKSQAQQSNQSQLQGSVCDIPGRSFHLTTQSCELWVLGIHQQHQDDGHKWK